MRRFLPVLALLLAAVPAHAMYMRREVQEVPVDRLTRNLEARLEAKPRDPAILLDLGRLHAMAYALKTDVAKVESGTTSLFLGYGSGPRIRWKAQDARDEAKKQAGAEHLKKAVATYRECLEADGDNEAARLGLAWCLLESGEKDEPRTLLRKLVADGWAKEKAEDFRAPDHVFLTEEAGAYLLPLLDSKADADEIEKLREKLDRFEGLPRAVTPILVPLDATARLEDLVAPDARVRFDVDGRERPGTWSWITPRAGWLVWLPADGSREVRSGLQLFGSVSFWLFWRDGYEPLAALDDDRDGSLRGRELERLGVWQDANGNGRVEPGEVRTLEECGIVALACGGEASDRPGVARWAPRGVVFASGEARPTWDVILRYAPPAVTTARSR